jgi:hypothetical protein
MFYAGPMQVLVGLSFQPTLSYPFSSTSNTLSVSARHNLASDSPMEGGAVEEGLPRQHDVGPSGILHNFEPVL